MTIYKITYPNKIFYHVAVSENVKLNERFFDMLRYRSYCFDENGSLIKIIQKDDISERNCIVSILPDSASLSLLEFKHLFVNKGDSKIALDLLLDKLNSINNLKYDTITPIDFTLKPYDGPVLASEIFQNVLNVEGLDQEEQKAILKSMTVYRVMRLEHFKSWCDSNQNVLVPVEWWDDPWERALFQNPINICNIFSLNPTNFKFYGQCWSLEKEESDATWRIFKANNSQCIRVGVNAWDLYEHFKNSCDELSGEGYSLHSCFAGLVKYMDENDIINSLSASHFEDCLTNIDPSLVETLFIKRMAFKHEKEFRLIYYYATNDSLVDDSSIPSDFCGHSIPVLKPDGNNLIRFVFPVSKIKTVTIGPKITHCPCELQKRKIECDNLISQLMRKGIPRDIISISSIYDFPELDVNY